MWDDLVFDSKLNVAKAMKCLDRLMCEVQSVSLTSLVRLSSVHNLRVGVMHACDRDLTRSNT